MNTKRDPHHWPRPSRRLVSLVTLIGLILAAGPAILQRVPAPPSPPLPVAGTAPAENLVSKGRTLPGLAARERALSEPEVASIGAQIREAGHWFTPHDGQWGGGGGLTAPNPRERISLHADPAGFIVKPWEGDWSVRFGGAAAGTAVPPETEKGNVTWKRTPEVVEWLQNAEGRIEHGFTLGRDDDPSGPRRVPVKLETGLAAEVTSAGDGLVFRDSAGRAVMRYDHTVAYDARGWPVPVQIELADAGRFDFVLDDAAAAYPVVIDPLISTPGLELRADETGNASYFGPAISLDGGFLAVGHPMDDGGQVYIFERRTDGGWEKVAKIAPSDGALAGSFGISVSLQGGRLAVGASGYAPVGWMGAEKPGAVYLFERQTDGTWPQMARMTSSDPATSLYLGATVSLSGDRVAAGTSYRFPHPNEAAYVFARQSDGTWLQEARLVGADSVTGDHFGSEVALSGPRLAVGANGDSHSGLTNAGSIYLFERNPVGGSWIQVGKLVASDAASNAFFGSSLALTAGRLAVGGSWAGNPAINAGAVYVFDKPINGPWNETAKIVPPDSAELDQFGRSVSLDGTGLLIGSGLGGTTANPGRAYLYERAAGGAWVLRERLESFDPLHSDSFGTAVVLKGDMVAIGSRGRAIEPVVDGRVTLFTRGRSDWPLAQSIGTTPTELGVQRMGLGESLCLSGDLLLAGAPHTSNQARGGASVGAAYLFERDKSQPNRWELRKALLGLDTASGDFFGTSVGMGGDLIVVGAPKPGGAGAAYLFQRDQGGPGNWGQKKKLVGAPAGARLGATVAVGVEMIAVGSPQEDSQKGKVRVFHRDTGGAGNWGLVKTLDDPGAGAGTPNQFGAALAISEGRLLVGSPGANVPTANGPAADGGRAYLFEQHLGGAHNLGLRASMPEFLAAQGYSGRAGGRFGSAVALDGDLALVGEAGGAPGAGRAYLYERNTGGVDDWDMVKSLAPAQGNGKPVPEFGHAVALGHGVAAVSSAGSGVLLYERNNGGADAWGFSGQLIDRQLSIDEERFGAALAFDGSVLAVGEPGSLEYGIGGAVRIYARRFDGWQQARQFSGIDTGAGDAFGTSLAIRGDWLLVGAPNQTNFTGAAYLFRRNTGGSDHWGALMKLAAADSAVGDYFGQAVSLDGQFAIVGAPQKTKIENVAGVPTPRLKAGAAYLYGRNQGGVADSWSPVLKVVSPLVGAAAANDFFGSAVALESPLAVVGMPGDILDKGRVFVYALLSNGGWGLQANLQPAAVVNGDLFGASVAVSGETILAGSPFADTAGGGDAGAAYLFARNAGGTYDQVGQVTAPIGAVGAKFGTSVALHGDIGAVGAPGDNAQGTNAGAAYVLRRAVDGVWGVPVILRPAAGLAGATFGASLALRDSTLAIGAGGSNGSTGAVHVYERWALDGWHPVQMLASPDAEALEFFGNAVALDGHTLAIGSRADDDAGVNSGSVSLFVLRGRPFDTWRRALFGDAVVNNPAMESTHWGDLADPDGDGLTNVEEAWFGLNPTQFNTQRPVTCFREPGSGNLIARWMRDPFDRGLRARPRYSLDLQNWFTDGTGPGDVGRTLEFHDLGGAPLGTVEARLHSAGLPATFLRLEIWRE